MNAVIDSILSENLAYYRRTKSILVGRLLINERGTLIRKQKNSKAYKYVRSKVNGLSFDRYIGSEDSPYARKIENRVKQSKIDLEELRSSKYALKRLRAKDMQQEDFTGLIKELFQLMEREGLWDEGLQLIGSWCFKFYQNYLGVECYPERTVDVDFAIKIPYQGRPAKIGEKLVELGFQEDRNTRDGSIVYLGGDIKVEFLTDQKGNGRNSKNTYVPELDIAPQALPYLRILLDHPVTHSIRDLGKITVPSMPAFLVHKLVVVSKRRDPGKKEKDLRQAMAIAEAIVRDPKQLEAVRTVFRSLHKKRQKMARNSAFEADETVRGATAVFQEVLGLQS